MLSIRIHLRRVKDKNNRNMQA